MTETILPLFPLQSVLFPQGILPLRIFEQRYLTLVRNCMRHAQGFGICLIRTGHEVGDAADCFEVGTQVRIEDWDHTPDGLLAIVVRGERRFRIVSRSVQADQLLVARVEWLAQPAPQPVPTQFQALAVLVDQVLNQLGPIYQALPRQLNDADWVSARLTEYLPLPAQEKQSLLELEDAVQRLQRLAAQLQR